MSSARMSIYRNNGWPGGQNSNTPSYRVRPDELVLCKNLRVEQGGYLVPRKGMDPYQVVYAGGAVKGAYRYEQTNGNKEVVAASGSAPATIYADAGTGTFAALGTTLTESADGYLRFAQWRNTLFCLSDAADILVYHRGGSPVQRDCDIVYPNYAAITSNAPVAGGQLEDGKTYTYRCTVDFEMNGDFMCETRPIIEAGVSYNQTSQTIVASSGNNTIQITRGTTGAPSGLLAEGARLNIYRTTALDAAVVATIKDPQFWFLTSIDAATYNAAAQFATIYTDDGTVDLTFGRRTSQRPGQISYLGLDKPPRVRFAISHKNRMWFARTSTDPHYLYFSEYLEPEKVRSTSFVPIGYGGNATGGGPITAIGTLMNRELVIGKANSLWRVAGGDDETIPGVPDIEVEMISPMVGILAPESLVVAEGALMWLGHRGVWLYDGTVPQELRTHEIKNILDAATAAQKQAACGVYHPARREYWLGIGSTVVVYSFITNSWCEFQFKDGGTAVTYNHLLAIIEAGAAVDILGCTDAATTNEFQLLDSVDADDGVDIDWQATTGHIELSDSATMLYGCIPVLDDLGTEDITVKVAVDDNRTGAFALSKTVASAPRQQRPFLRFEPERCTHAQVDFSASTQVSGISIQGYRLIHERTQDMKVTDE